MLWLANVWPVANLLPGWLFKYQHLQVWGGVSSGGVKR